MTIHFNENRLALIGAQSSRWPDPSISLFWKAAHAFVAAMVQRAREADQTMDRVETDTNLSDAGRLSGITAAALAAVNALDNVPELTAMEKRAAADTKLFEQKKKSPEAATVDSAVAAQIREKIAAQRENASSFALKHAADPAVVAAVRDAPAFLSGLSDSEKSVFLKHADGVLFPDSVARIAAIDKALAHARDTVAQVTTMIAERGQLIKTLGTDGKYRWEARSRIGRAAA